MKKKDIRNLKFRYLLWLYKTSREEIDRIERKFTQLDIDKAIIEDIKRKIKPQPKSKLKKYLEAFKQYVDKKEKDGRHAKYKDKKNLKDNYHFLILNEELTIFFPHL